MVGDLNSIVYLNKQVNTLLKEIETRYFYLFHDALKYDTIDDKTYEALLHLGDIINPEKLKECCKNVNRDLAGFHINSTN